MRSTTEKIWTRKLHKMIDQAVEDVPANQRGRARRAASHELVAYLWGCGNMTVRRANPKAFLAGFIAGRRFER